MKVFCSVLLFSKETNQLSLLIALLLLLLFSLQAHTGKSNLRFEVDIYFLRLPFKPLTMEFIMEVLTQPYLQYIGVNCITSSYYVCVKIMREPVSEES